MPTSPRRKYKRELYDSPNMADGTTMNVWLPKELKEQVAIIAHQRKVSRSSIVQEAVTEWLAGLIGSDETETW